MTCLICKKKVTTKQQGDGAMRTHLYRHRRENLAKEPAAGPKRKMASTSQESATTSRKSPNFQPSTQVPN